MDLNIHLGQKAKVGARLTLLAAAVALASCGGGGGASDAVGNPKPPAPRPEAGGGTAVKVDSLRVLEIGIYDAAGNPLSNVGASGAVLKVKITTERGQAVKEALVNFSSSADDLVFGNTSGAVLTDANGEAQLFFKPVSTEVSGAYTLFVAAMYDGSEGSFEANRSIKISVSPTNVSLTELAVGDAVLPSGGQTSISLKTQDIATNTPLNGVTVNFSSDCGQVTPSSYNSANQGDVLVSYKAVNADGTLCAGTVNINALTNAGSSSQNRTTSLVVEAPKVTSMLYPEGQAATIGIEGSGSSSQALVKFVVYSNNTPIAGKEVTFSLEKSPLGLSIGESGRTTWSVKTDENGEAPITIYPGSTPGPVEIRATVVDSPEIFALSKDISVASSRASQEGLSLALTANNIEGWNYDGTQSTLTMRVADKFGNAVPDGTVVNFTSEGGQIASSCATVKVEGISQCAVVFESQDFRPLDGRVTILAVVEGEKAYVDNNKNNMFDAGDMITSNIGDTFRDDNENGVYDAGELIYPLRSGAAGTCSSGLSVHRQPNMPNTCSEELDAPLRSQLVMLLAGSRPHIEVLEASRKYYEVKIWSIGPTDSAGNYILPMPGGTTVEGSIVKGSDSSECTLAFTSGESTIPSVVGTGFIAENAGRVPDLGTTHGFTMRDCTAIDALAITVTTPKGIKVSTLYALP
ncbi:MAG: hypothetical protein VXW65_02935 [Pseudomonadota bacterium]|nr:hypothetical protein [Pseudomonadota bacterium]